MTLIAFYFLVITSDTLNIFMDKLCTGRSVQKSFPTCHLPLFLSSHTKWSIYVALKSTSPVQMDTAGLTEQVDFFSFHFRMTSLSLLPVEVLWKMYFE